MVNHHIPNCWNKGFYIMDPSKYGKSILKTASALVWASFSSSAWKCHLLVLRTPLAFGPQCIICNWIGPKISSPWHLRAFPLWAGTLFALVIGLNGGHRKSFVIVNILFIVDCISPLDSHQNFPFNPPSTPPSICRNSPPSSTELLCTGTQGGDLGRKRNRETMGWDKMLDEFTVYYSIL